MDETTPTQPDNQNKKNNTIILFAILAIALVGAFYLLLHDWQKAQKLSIGGKCFYNDECFTNNCVYSKTSLISTNPEFNGNRVSDRLPGIFRYKNTS